MATSDTVRGTATIQGRLWGARARDWAEIGEAVARDLYPPVLNAAGVGPGTRLLDVGCGSGVAADVASGSGARVTGLDASAPSIELARERVPGADFAVGEMEALPYADDAFDVVTSFNAFQYAADPVNAVREARRVARAGGSVVAVTWGPADQCEAAPYLRALGALLPPAPAGAPGPFALSAPGALERLLSEAGLEVRDGGTVSTVWRYEDEPTMLRGMLSAGPSVRAIEHSGEQRVAAAALDALAPCRTAAGGYAIANAWSYVIGTG
jgi:SAM-dependent methyltransferase